jgi:arylsulfatase A-like enzyme
MQTDATVGAITVALKKQGFADNTLVLFTSDNGSAYAADLKKKGHHVSAHYRGAKADSWDGGHRVPFIVRWPGHVEAGSQSDQLITLVDVFATASEITGAEAPDMGEDSVSFFPALLGKPIESTRNGVIHHSYSGHFSYRQGKWKLILARGSGGWSSPNEKASRGALEAQLYNMEEDPSEQNNLYLDHPKLAQLLLTQLTSDIERGRSTDGPTVYNDIKGITLWKSGRGIKKIKSSK